MVLIPLWLALLNTALAADTLPLSAAEPSDDWGRAYRDALIALPSGEEARAKVLADYPTLKDEQRTRSKDALATLIAVQQWAPSDVAIWVGAALSTDEDVRAQAVEGARAGAIRAADGSLRTPPLGSVARWERDHAARVPTSWELGLADSAPVWQPLGLVGVRADDASARSTLEGVAREPGWFVRADGLDLLDTSAIGRTLSVDAQACGRRHLEWTEHTSTAARAIERELRVGLRTVTVPVYLPGSETQRQRSGDVAQRPDECLSESAVDAAIEARNAALRARLKLEDFPISHPKGPGK